MANLTGFNEVFPGDTDQIDTTRTITLLSRARDTAGNEYIYLAGTASTVAGKWVTFSRTGSTTLLAANAVGPVAVAMTRNIADASGAWYLVYGTGTATVADTGSSAGQLFISGTASYAGFTDTSTEAIVGAQYVAGTATGGTASVTVWLNYPLAINAALD